MDVGFNVVRDVLIWKIDPGTVKVLNRPGAWLLDCTYTQHLAISGLLPRAGCTKYRVISNKSLSKVAEQLIHHCSIDVCQFCSSSNNRGKQMELLVWLALETDKIAIALALVWHARLS